MGGATRPLRPHAIQSTHSDNGGTRNYRKTAVHNKPAGRAIGVPAGSTPNKRRWYIIESTLRAEGSQ